jgi:hypothetical protein
LITGRIRERERERCSNNKMLAAHYLEDELNHSNSDSISTDNSIRYNMRWNWGRSSKQGDRRQRKVEDLGTERDERADEQQLEGEEEDEQ